MICINNYKQKIKMLARLAAAIALTQTIVVSSSSPFNDKGDFIPRDKYEAAYPQMPLAGSMNDEPKEMVSQLTEMSHEKMMENRLTDHYQDFVNGLFVNTIETIARPFVQ